MNEHSTAQELRDFSSAATTVDAQQVIDKAIQRRMTRQQKRHRGEIEALHQQIVRLSADNARLRDRAALAETRATRAEGEALAATARAERRDQTIAGLRQALNNRKDQIHV